MIIKKEAWRFISELYEDTIKLLLSSNTRSDGRNSVNETQEAANTLKNCRKTVQRQTVQTGMNDEKISRKQNKIQNDSKCT